MTVLTADLDRFVARLRTRLVKGAATYGSTSFTRPPAQLVDELMEEVEDIAGWGLLLWIRLDRLRGRVEELDQGGTDGKS